MSSISARFYPCYPRGITPHDVIEKIPRNLLPSWEQKSAHRTQLHCTLDNQDIDLIDKNRIRGSGVRAPEKGYTVAPKTVPRQPKTSLAPPQNDSEIERVKLTGHTARRRADGRERVIWDTKYPGFGLRFRASGHKTWIVSYRQRRIRRTATLGIVADMSAKEARREARRILSEAQLEGLPTKAKEAVKTAPLFSDYVAEFWTDYARHWKPTTARRSKYVIKLQLVPFFGEMTLDAIKRTDIARWRDGLSGSPTKFNSAIPVLSVMMKYAEQLGYRRTGSNPCRGTPRYKTQLHERYLSPAEYRRLASSLNDMEQRFPQAVAIIWLLMFTGARSHEIRSLRWEYVKSPRLMLPDSKTGAKTIYLNTQAQAILDRLPNPNETGLVFPSASNSDEPIGLNWAWEKIRRRAALPELRMHDLRHSFASVAIRDGISLLVIGKLLGHALPETTARYAHLADETILDSATRVCSSIATAMRVGQ